ncbi:MAG: DUF305 domain-containing protein [Alphaproteobacteria bacterium]|nr:DUF305 domain-containing protein [Alphaproteobacteria bacterium]
MKANVTLIGLSAVMAASLFIRAPIVAEAQQAQAQTAMKAMPAVAAPSVSVPAPPVPVEAATGDADLDFVNAMIPQQQATVELAKKELEKGKDPEIRKLAESIVSTQEGNIAVMKEWQAKHVQMQASMRK